MPDQLLERGGFEPPRPFRTGEEEFGPMSGKKAIEAARSAGLNASSIPTVLVQGDNRRGLGHTIAKALGDAGINLSFVLAQVVGRKYAAVFGFENDSDAAKAVRAACRPSWAPGIMAIQRVRRPDALKGAWFPTGRCDALAPSLRLK